MFDSDGRRIAEYDEATGALLREYVWNGWDPVALIEGGTVYYVRADHIGRPVFATNSSGAKVWEATYTPFGGVHTSTGNLPANRFPGQWFQTESGLHQNWMRDYDPTTGRYLEPDPLGLVDGASVYGYVSQSPMMLTDPTGECPWCLPIAVAAGGALLGYLLNQWADYLEDESGCGPCTPLWQSDALSAVAGASAADGSGFGPKRFRTPGASSGTSIQSKVLRILFPQRLPRRVYTPSTRWPWPRTAGVGAAAGRWLPLVGYGMIGYDMVRIIRCLTK